MGLSASMWTSVSGLLTHGEKMNVVGNNIANVSTIGFKGQRADFNDYLYLSGGSTSGPTQIGAGVSTYAIIGDFSQGSLEATNSVTDMAIDGNGFFKVRQPNTNQMYYTRAGDFYFNADRQLQNPEGYRLQGWKVDGSSNSINFMGDSVNIGENQKGESAFQGIGTPTDIVLDSWYLNPQRTSSVSFTMGLTSDSENDRTTSKPDASGKTNPTAALWGLWNANNVGNPPIADSAYATSSSIKTYDESGLPHTMTVYYDQVNSATIDHLPAGCTMYEYTVTIPASEDKRFYTDANDKRVNLYNGEAENDKKVNSDKAGMLMTGTLIFDASGNLLNQSAYTWNGKGDIDDMANWETTLYSNNGLPVFTANFTGQENASTVFVEDPDTVKNYLIELDFGLRNLDNVSTKPGQTLDQVGSDYNNLALFNKTHKMANASMAASSTFVVQDSTQNGYPSGILSGTNITNDGVVYGYYDNGETVPLYQIALYDFHNKQGLRREGGNLYAQTKESGEARQGVAGDNGFGAVRAYNIEGSNVDMSREFVNMITTQRGFQANSKGITTVDNMLETVIGMKR